MIVLSDVREPEAPAAHAPKMMLSVLLALIAGIGGCSYLVDRFATVPTSDIEVLDALAEDLAQSADLTIIKTEATDRSPCWWWCEDYVLELWVRAEVAVPAERSLAEVCEAALSGFSTILGPPTSTDLGNARYRVCLPGWWGVEYHGREVLVSLDVAGDDSPSGANIDLSIRNESSERAFLPWGG